MKAILALADGTVFQGRSVGIEGIAVGEVVFNTAMTGYQEIITDPSYAKQIITFTNPHIGNTGINFEDDESSSIWVSGVIAKEFSSITSNWRSKLSFFDWIKQHNIIAIDGVNTRLLTRYIRYNGSQKCCIMAGNIEKEKAKAKAITLVKETTLFNTMDLIRLVSTKRTYQFGFIGDLLQTKDFKFSTLVASSKSNAQKIKEGMCKIVVIDFGVKYSILKRLAENKCSVIVVSASTSVKDILKLQPDGIVLSNGPGDPNDAIELLQNVKELVNTGLPIMGICLGFQLLVLAMDGKIKKMKFGHHGANHPVKDLETGKVFITSQNHNYAVDESSISSDITDLVITHRSLFDHSIQGIRSKNKLIYGYQWHPEAGPGPVDTVDMFKEFVDNIALHPTLRVTLSRKRERVK